MAVEYQKDDSLMPNESYYRIDDGQLLIIAPSLQAFKSKLPTVYKPTKAKGSGCPGFSMELSGIKKKVDCVFQVLTRTTSNSQVRKDGSYNRCHGCVVLNNNLAINKKVSLSTISNRNSHQN